MGPRFRPFHFFSNAARAREIIATLARWGFEGLLIQLGTPSALLRRLVRTKTVPLSTFQRIRAVCEDLGPTFVKLGQILATRPDLVPPALAQELRLLQDQVPAEPAEVSRRTLEEELEGTVADHFRDFDEVPAAAGSLGMVYRAILKDSGERVAVKIQRTGIQKMVAADLEILGWLARQVHERIETLQPFNLPSILAELMKELLAELDFATEARNAQLFNINNPDPEHIFAPKVYSRFTTNKIIVTEWIDGQRPDKVALTAEEGAELATIGGRSIFHQIIVDGFFHSDPHTGNILVTKDKRLCLVDWGQVGQLTIQMRYLLADLLGAIISRNAEKVVRVAFRMGRNSERIDREKLEQQVGAVLRRHAQLSEDEDVEVGLVGLELIYVFGANGIKVSPEYALLAKAVISVERTGRELDPEFDIYAIARPYLEKLQFERMNPIRSLERNWWQISESLRIATALPADLQRLLHQFEEEKISVNLSLKNTDHLEGAVKASSNRLSVAVVIASIIIGSSMVITTGVEPLLWGFPMIGIVGFVASGLLGLLLIIDVIFNRGHH
jgi:ubiquinone biosynthesis protein